MSHFGSLVSLNQGHRYMYQKMSNTHRLTLCGLKKLASWVFPEIWKVLARSAVAEAAAETGWLNKIHKDGDYLATTQYGWTNITITQNMTQTVRYLTKTE